MDELGRGLKGLAARVMLHRMRLWDHRSAAGVEAFAANSAFVARRILKAYRRDIVQDVKLYGQMHRFIPVFCKWQGGTVTELPVSYRPRMFGQSNYGLFRIYKVILDLILIRFLEKFMTRPIHFFGGVGILSFLMSFFTFGVAGYFKLTGEKDFVETPLPILSAMFFTVGVLMVLLGIISEIMMRTYFESQNSAPFSIRDRVNF